MPKRATRKPNEPFKVSTKSLALRRTWYAFLTVAVIAGGGGYYAWSNGMLNPPADQPSNQQVNVNADDGSASDSSMTIDGAKQAVFAYYDALSKGDTSTLRTSGFNTAANAIDQGWLSAIGYSVSQVVQPDVSQMPESVGTYAGNTVYAMSSFYTRAPESAVHSNVTGDTGYVGWMYYDTMTNAWVVVDPTIPTATQAAEDDRVTRRSSDGQVTVSVQSRGAVANPWWSQMSAQLSVESAQGVDAKTSDRTLDNGITVSVTDTIRNQTVNGSKAEGEFTLTRGVTSDFSSDRIGQPAQSIEGNIMPITVQTDGEDVTPVFTIGTSSISQTAIAEDQTLAKKYGINVNGNGNTATNANGKK